MVAVKRDATPRTFLILPLTGKYPLVVRRITLYRLEYCNLRSTTLYPNERLRHATQAANFEVNEGHQTWLHTIVMYT